MTTQAALSQILGRASNSPLPINETIPGFIEEALDDRMLDGDPADWQELAEAVGEHITMTLDLE